MNYCEGFFKNCPEALSKKQTEEYFKLINEGQKELEDKIIEGNLRFVVHIISKNFFDVNNYKQHFDIKDLISIGIIGLIKAVRSYKLETRCSFSTYAYKVIMNEILMEFRKNKRHQNNSSLDRIVSVCDRSNIEITFLDNLYEDTNIQEDYELKEEHENVREAIETLDEIEKLIIKLHYKDTLTHQSIGDLLGYSQSTINRKDKKAREKIKTYLINNKYN